MNSPEQIDVSVPAVEQGSGPELRICRSLTLI